MEIGQRVEVRHLMRSGEKLYGTVIAFRKEKHIWFGFKTSGIATIKLDIQDKPLKGVLCYEDYPTNAPIPGCYWQICFPINESIQ